MSRDELSDLIIRCVQTLSREKFGQEFKEITTALESYIERLRAVTGITCMIIQLGYTQQDATQLGATQIEVFR